MIVEKYQASLQKFSKELDFLESDNTDFEKLTNEIISDKNERSILEFWKKLSSVPATKQEEAKSLLLSYLGAEKVEGALEVLRESSTVPLPKLMKQLDELVGLTSVKQQVRDLLDYNQIQKLRVDNGLSKSHKTLHMAFLGNPGTAKTTVARIVGRMYKSMGLISKGQFIEASRTDLIAEYQGQTATKVKRLVKKAIGGVLFIDEAYSITENDHSDSYGRECLTELTKALEDYREDLVVIVAGYSDLMTQFFQSNPGLKSRFNTFITFEDYSLEELVGIFEYTCKKNDYVSNSATLDKVRIWLQGAIDKKDENFSNGRLVRNLFDDVTLNQAKRLARYDIRLSKEVLIELQSVDVPE